MKYITAIQVILFFISYFQAGSLDIDKITVKQFAIIEIALWSIMGVLQIIKLAVSTRNTHSR